MTLKADITDAVNAFVGAGAGVTNGLNVQFRISNVATHTATSDVSAKGATSGTYATGTAVDRDANSMKVVMTKPTFACVAGSAGCDGASKTLVPGTIELLRFKITADSMNDVTFDGTNHNIRFTIVSNKTNLTTARAFSLYDAGTDTVVSTSGVSTAPNNGVVLNFTDVDTVIPKGELKTCYVKGNLVDYTSLGDSFQLYIANTASDLSWSDGSGAITGATVDISDALTGKGIPLYGGVFVKP